MNNKSRKLRYIHSNERNQKVCPKRHVLSLHIPQNEAKLILSNFQGPDSTASSQTDTIFLSLMCAISNIQHSTWHVKLFNTGTIGGKQKWHLLLKLCHRIKKRKDTTIIILPSQHNSDTKAKRITNQENCRPTIYL